MLIARLILAAVVGAALAGCGAGTLPQPVAANAQAAGAERVSASAVAISANGVMALPGNGVLALPGNGVLALPGNGVLALPGNGVLALPGSGLMALPGGSSAAQVLAALGNALPLCAVNALVGAGAQCNALLNLAIPVNPVANTAASSLLGLHPADLVAAYHAGPGGRGKTVAVVDAGDGPTAESDLAVYRAAFGLPPCTSASGCFRKVNQSGAAGPYPAMVTGWPQEIGVDVQMVSAVCPSCNILLVEANSADISDLAAGVDTAAKLGANAISNSYYTPEYSGELADETHFNHPGIAITVSSGDMAYGTTFPASSRYVTAVSGTTLSRGGLAFTQSVWSSTSSGCSAYVPKPAWQHDTGCPNRTVADVAVVADPQTGVAAYNSTAIANRQGWGVYGGTSVGAPIVAALAALSTNAHGSGAANSYANPGAFAPILFGKNGTCSPSYLCTAGPGYSGPGGVGSPLGVSGL